MADSVSAWMRSCRWASAARAMKDTTANCCSLSCCCMSWRNIRLAYKVSDHRLATKITSMNNVMRALSEPGMRILESMACVCRGTLAIEARC